MNKELQNNLAKAYPKIFKNVGGDETKTCMAHGIQCNDGWYDLLDSLCFCIQQHCNVENTRYIIETDKYEFIEDGDPEYVQVVAAQVKEKMGELRFYTDGGDATTEGMIQMAETMSGRICELCGSPAKTNRDSGWLHTICDACNKRIRLERKGWKSGSVEEFLTDSNPDNNPDKVSQYVKLRNEIDGLKYVVKKLEQEAKEWNLRLQDPAPIHVLSCANMSFKVSQGHRDEITQLRQERDEARREVCEMNAFESTNESVEFHSISGEDIAEDRGWDCYKKEETK